MTDDEELVEPDEPYLKRSNSESDGDSLFIFSSAVTDETVVGDDDDDDDDVLLVLVSAVLRQ